MSFVLFQHRKMVYLNYAKATFQKFHVEKIFLFIFLQFDRLDITVYTSLFVFLSSFSENLFCI